MRRYPLSRALVWLLLLIVCVAVLLCGIVWFQERPLALARHQLDSGDADGALTTVNRFLREHPKHGRALALKARIFVALGDADRAIDLFERVGAEDEAELHALAKALLVQQQWSVALPILEHLQETSDDKADVLHELAACRAKLGNYDGALSAAEAFSKVPGFQARGQLLVGTIHRERGNLQRAAAAWGDVLRVQPDASGLQISAAEFLLEYGRVLSSLGNAAGGVELIDRSIALAPSAEALIARGDALTQLGSAQEAEDAYRRALDLRPAETAARVGLAQSAMSRGDAAGALNWLKPIDAEHHSTSEVAYLFQRAYARLGDAAAAEHWRSQTEDLRRRERADEAADLILRHSPESEWAQIIRAHRFAESGNWEEAERILKPLAPAAEKSPFVQSLVEAVRVRGPLPALDGLPVRQF